MKSFSNHYLSFLILLLFSYLQVSAQDPDPFSYASRIQPSAEAWQIARHGEISPDLFTGAMAWSLPLYTYKDEDFTIPISLDYRFDGCRPTQPAGTVGMGWSLNCGGVITRQVVGLPDDYIRQVSYVDTDGEQHDSWEVGYYFAAVSHSHVSPSALSGLLSANAYMNSSHCIGQVSPAFFDCDNNFLAAMMGTTPLLSCNTISLLNGGVEGGPFFDPGSDIYHFSLPTVSGDFVILSNGSIKVFNSSVPEGEITVMLYFSELIYLNKIVILHRGYRYEFGGGLEHLEYSFIASTGSYNDPSVSTRYCFTAMRLNTVTAPNARHIVFSHQSVSPCLTMTWKNSVKYKIQGLAGQPQKTWPSVTNSISRPLQAIIVDGDTLVLFHYADKAQAEFGYSAFHSLTQNQYNNIRPLGQGFPTPITPESFNRANRLASVTIRNRSGDLIDSISLSQHYTSSSPGHSSKMFLDAVNGNNGRYKFSYNFAGGSDAYPPVDTVATDHWGFWNGGGAPYPDTTSHRQRSSLYDLPSAVKDPDSIRTMHGALQRIDYPSGGWTSINYECNRVYRCIDTDTDGEFIEDNIVYECPEMTVGGVRVKSLESNAGSQGGYVGSILFEYGQSGTLMKMPRYFLDITSDFYYKKWYQPVPHLWEIETGEGSFSLSTFDPGGLSVYISDGHVGYDTVCIHYADGSFTEHRYYGYQDYPDVHLALNNVIAQMLGSVCSKVLPGVFQVEQGAKGYYILSEPSGDTLSRNAALAGILLKDGSSFRGKPLSKATYNADSLMVARTDYAWREDTVSRVLGVYNIFSSFVSADRTFIQPRLDSVVTTEYLPGGGSLSDTTLYTYNDLGQQTVVEKRGFDGTVLRSRLRYEHESDTTAPWANISEAASTRIVPEGDSVLEYVTSLRHFEYDTDSARRRLPVLAVDYGRPYPWTVSADTTISWYTPLAPEDSVVRRLSYNTKQRLDSLLLPGGAYVAFVWDTSGRYPLSREDNGPSMVSTYQWKDMVGLTKKTGPTLRSEWYAYDSKWRLSEVRRADSVKVATYDNHLWCEDSTAGPSYTKQTTWRTSNKNNRDIVYYDGLGYPIQKVRTSTQTQWGHIVTPIRYDALRRDDARSYLPYEARYSTYNSADTTAQSQYYKLEFGNSEIYPYAEKTYGTSPAGRLLSSRQPGKDYADSSKVVTYDYRTNSAADSILDLRAVVDTSFKLKVGNGYLPAGRLLLTKTTDEDGCTSEVFTDASGKTVLSRQRTGGQRLDTYRVYDLRDSLVCVLQPEGVASIVLGSSHTLLPPPAKNSADTIPAVDDLLEKYAFLYSWDSRGMLAAKKRPGAAAEEFLSDDRGRVVLSRDGNLRSQGKWLYSEYDGYDALLKKSLISVELGLDTLRRAARNQVDSSSVVVIDSIRLWEFVLNGEPQSSNRVYSKMTLPAAGDSLFTEDCTFTGLSSGTGFDAQGAYFLKGTQKYYPTFSSIFFDAEWAWQIDADWPAIFADAITSNTLIEEHRYDRGDNPEVPGNLAFDGVTGIVAGTDLGTSRNLEVWQRQLMLPPGRTVPGDTTRYVERAFYYDVPGNLVQTVEKNALGGTSRTSAKYDYLGNVTASEEKHSRAGISAVDVKRTSYAYDKHGRVSSEYVALNNTAITSTEFDYDIFGRLTWIWGQGEDFEKAVQETYSYDIRGRLLAKEAFRMSPYVPGPGSGGGNGGDEEEEEEEEEDPEWDAVSLFNMTLRYSNPQKSASVRKWNGLISEIAHQWGDNGSIITNDYFYDNAGRLVDHMRYDGASQTNKYTERDLSFDRNGNILTLKRYGTNIAAPQDNLAYTYEGNKLMQLNNWEYGYDDNGNMTSDERRNLTFTWNHINLPATITNNGATSATVNYTYLADGTKVLAQPPGTNEGYAYLGTMVYKLDNVSWTLETTPFTGGRFVRNATGDFVEQRHITDHLGSACAIVEGDNYTEVEQNDYYPFGKRIADNSLPTTATNRWRFSGKEIQTLGEINLIDFGARLYDVFSGRWKTQDVLSEEYFSQSPYSFCGNNAISIIDPSGMNYYAVDSTGNIVLVQATDDSFDRLYHYVPIGPLGGNNYVQVNDQSILSQLSQVSANGFSMTELSDNLSELMTVFFFAADNSSVEWAIYSTDAGSVLGTKHNSISSGSWEDYIDSHPVSKIHSHPDVATDTRSEFDSMGYWLHKSAYDSQGNLINRDVSRTSTGDWLNYRNEYESMNKPTKSRIYFPNSHRIYRLYYNEMPSYIKR